MSFLTQAQIEELTAEQYCQLLACGEIGLFDDDELSEEYHRILRHFIEFDI
jgi:hypothetical protein